MCTTLKPKQHPGLHIQIWKKKKSTQCALFFCHCVEQNPNYCKPGRPAPGHQTRWRGGNQAPPDSQLIANHRFSKIRLLILPLHIMNNSSTWEALSCAFGKTGTAQWELLYLNCTACFCHYCNLIFTPQFIASLFKGWGQQHWWAGYSYECHERKSRNMNILFCPSGRVQKRSAKAARATSGRGKTEDKSLFVFNADLPAYKIV